VTWKYTKQEVDAILDALPVLEAQVVQAHDVYHALCKQRGQMKTRLESICEHDEGTYTETEGAHRHARVQRGHLGSYVLQHLQEEARLEARVLDGRSRRLHSQRAMLCL